MFIEFFYLLKSYGLPVSTREHLTLLEALDKELPAYRIEDFYALSKAIYIKHEQHLDLFDRLFADFFKNIDSIPAALLAHIPAEWLQRGLEERVFTEEEKALIEALGGLETLMERFQEILDKQKEQHQGGDTFIGTGGTSPFGAYGYNPEGFRIGQQESRHRKAIKVWDKRLYKNLDGNQELNTRDLKLALKRLRILTREGLEEELDLDKTIAQTCRNAGSLDLALVPSKKNRVKVLMLFDIGGSMDEHVALCEQLFSAARYEFKHLEYYYFHNCLYEFVWKDNRRRYEERIPTMEIFQKYNADYKVIVVGDATMSPYELTHKNGSVEHYNNEPGLLWLQRLKEHYPYLVWLNPTPVAHWHYTYSVKLIREFSEERMFPLTLNGLSAATRALKDKKLKFED